KTKVHVTEIAIVSPAQSSTTLTATGYVVPLVISKVAPKITGKVYRVLVDEGQEVTEGEPLLELDATDQKASLAAAKARALAARASVTTAQANYEELAQQAERQRKLMESGAAPRSNFEDLTARLASLKSAVTSATAQVRTLEAEAKVLSVGLEHFTVRAPI